MLSVSHSIKQFLSSKSRPPPEPKLFEDNFDPQEGHQELSKVISRFAEDQKTWLTQTYAPLIQGGNPSLARTVQQVWHSICEKNDDTQTSEGDGSSPSTLKGKRAPAAVIAQLVIGDGSTVFCNEGQKVWTTCLEQASPTQEKYTLISVFVGTSALDSETVKQGARKLADAKSTMWSHFMICSDEKCTRSREECGNATATQEKLKKLCMQDVLTSTTIFLDIRILARSVT